MAPSHKKSGAKSDRGEAMVLQIGRRNRLQRLAKRCDANPTKAGHFVYRRKAPGNSLGPVKRWPVLQATT